MHTLSGSSLQRATLGPRTNGLAFFRCVYSLHASLIGEAGTEAGLNVYMPSITAPRFSRTCCPQFSTPDFRWKRAQSIYLCAGMRKLTPVLKILTLVAWEIKKKFGACCRSIALFSLRMGGQRNVTHVLCTIEQIAQSESSPKEDVCHLLSASDADTSTGI